MTAPTTAPVARRTVIGAAWAAPVIAVAVATPAHAASTPRPQLAGRADGPEEYPDGGASTFGVHVTNTGAETIPAGSIVATLTDSDPRFSYSGFSGQLWNYTSSFPDGSISFQYDAELVSGDETDILLLLIDSADRSQSPVPVAELVVTAPGFRAATVPLPIVY
ncbi:hypothetical protein [Herbiconiux flava]|uniref:Uncharacterized protein n=1 Tax=Herbiconiux flava TaxID=881268 RepID=A0A852SS76_9MICO|nr:hypothetical protein [Herbiconiux flava]NYD71554.1 hypothetical protein [Herbiconiux flava]GLK18481.1 hypothetical protein GCM10017602_29630 [Herbiconiux flava]